MQVREWWQKHNQFFQPKISELSLRIANPADAVHLTNLDKLSFGVHSWSQSLFEQELMQENRCFFTLWEDMGMGRQGLVATSGIFLGEICELLTIAVLPRWRRQGLATLLLTANLEIAQASQAKEVWLEVRARDLGAQSLYEQVGFTKMGLRKRYYSDDDAITMCCRLNESSDRG